MSKEKYLEISEVKQTHANLGLNLQDVREVSRKEEPFHEGNVSGMEYTRTYLCANILEIIVQQNLVNPVSFKKDKKPSWGQRTFTLTGDHNRIKYILTYLRGSGVELEIY